MKRSLYAAAVILAVLVQIVFAHDMFPPPWRGADGATYQQWGFSTADNPAAPEVMNNPFGGANASITVGLLGEGWLETLGFGTQTGIWDLGGTGGSIVLDIGNRPEALPYKELYIQITYFQDISQSPLVDVPGATYIGGQTGIPVEDTGMGSGWFLDQSIWRIEPNPSSEHIVLTSNADWGSLVDQIVVDTICIPEPATLFVLAAGLVAIAPKRRR